MNLYDIASKHGIPEEKEESDLCTPTEEYSHYWYNIGANAMKAQYDELLKGLVVSEEAAIKLAEKVFFDTESPIDVAKALANSTEIVTDLRKVE